MAEQSGSRLPLLEPQDMTPAQREVYERFTAPRPNGTRPKGTPYRITLHWPEFTGLWFQTGETLRKQGQLPASLSELVILMAVSHWQCEHAMGTHAMAARNKGLPESIVSAVLRGQRPEGMDAAQAAIHDYCNELQISHQQTTLSIPLHASYYMVPCRSFSR